MGDRGFRRVYKISGADKFAHGAACLRAERRSLYYDEEFTI